MTIAENKSAIGSSAEKGQKYRIELRALLFEKYYVYL